MAGTPKTVQPQGRDSELIEELRLTVNKLVDDIELIRTNFVAATPANVNTAATMTGYKLNAR